MMSCEKLDQSISINKDWRLKKETTFEFGHFYDHFGSICCQLQIYLSQNWGADSHFEMHNMFKSQLDQKLQHKSQMFLTTVFFNFGKKMQI